MGNSTIRRTQCDAQSADLKIALEHTPVGLLVLDRRCVIRDANGAAHALAGTQVIGRRFCDYFHADACAESAGPACTFHHALHGQERRTSPRWATLQVRGQPLTALLSSAPVQVAGSEVSGAMATIIPNALVDQADRRRRDLAAEAVHDMRHPLGVQALLLETLEADGLDGITPEMRAQVGKLRRINGYLVTVVDDLLNRMLFDLGGLVVRPQRTVLRLVLQQASYHLEPLLGQRRQRIALRAPVALEVWADAAALEHTIVNLVLNAHKYSVEGDTIIVSARKARDGMIEIGVRDHGPGIPVPERRRIFERFYRGTTAGTRRGAGLGLAIVRAYVESHGGQVGVGQGRGGGARFWFRLPALPPSE